MTRSIKTSFTLIFVAITAVLLLSVYLFSRFFLEDYYERDLERVLVLAYDTLDKLSVLAVDEGGSIMEFVEEEFDTGYEDSPAISIIRTLNEGSNIDIALSDPTGSETVTMSREGNWLARKLYTYVTLFGDSQSFLSDTSAASSGSGETAGFLSFSGLDEEELMNTGLLLGGADYKLIDASDHYIIHRVRDIRSEQEYVECFGIFSDGQTFFLMSSPTSNISEGARIAVRFMFSAGLAALLVGSIIVYIAVDRITKPLRKLAALSDQISRLDFSERYEGRSKNELGVLGNSMNTMSDMLESYIEELKNTNELLQKDLLDKIKVDEARKEFIANVSHELKTPIALIEGYAEGLSEGLAEDPEKRDYYCHVIMDETIKMNRMVRELTSLISYEFHADDTEFRVFDLAYLIRGVIDSMKLKLDEAGASVSLDLPETLSVNADEFRIEEAFTNYMSNAVNHLDFERRIAVSLSEEGGMATVTVYNDGENIPPESLPHIWEKFYKADKARTRNYGGSGIGLSIVRAVIDAHHGRVFAENRPGGVEFGFSIPVNID